MAASESVGVLWLQDIKDWGAYTLPDALSDAASIADPTARGYVWSRSQRFSAIAPANHLHCHKLLRDGTIQPFYLDHGEVRGAERQISRILHDIASVLGARTWSDNLGPSVVVIRHRSIFALYENITKHGWLFINASAPAHDRLAEIDALNQDFAGIIRIENPK